MPKKCPHSVALVLATMSLADAVHVGLEFKTRDDFKLAIIRIFVQTGKGRPKVLKSDKGRCYIVCSNLAHDCPFSAYASVVTQNKMWRITRFEPDHAVYCDPKIEAPADDDEEDNGNPNGNPRSCKIPTKLICHGLESHDFTFSSRDALIDDVKTTLHYNMPDYAVTRVMDRLGVTDNVRMAVPHYRRLPDLLRAICAANANTTTILSMNGRSGIFEGVFVCLGACKALNETFLPVVVLDAAWCKSLMRGHLLLAVQMDANHNILPIAFAVHPGNESGDSWRWFLINLKAAIPNFSNEIVFVADREKGLDTAISSVFPGNPIRFCFNHIKKNVASQKLGAAFQAQLYGLKNAQSIEAMDVKLNEIRSSGTHAQLRFLDNLQPSTFVKAFFMNFKTFGMDTNNIAESMNSVFLKNRDKPIDMLVLDIVLWTSKQFFDRQSKLQKSSNTYDLVPYALKHVQNLRQKAITMEVLPGTDYMQVIDGQFKSKVVWRNASNGEFPSCSCHFPADTGLPCAHVAAVALFLRKSLELTVEPIYRICVYRRSYELPIGLNPPDWSPNNAVEDPLIQLPTVRVPKGRPRKSRGKSALEHALAGVKRSNPAPRALRCSMCNQLGHNKKTCRSPVPSSSNQKQ